MKKIIVISDTHGNQKFLRKAFGNEASIDKIFHLGDYYDDIADNFDLIENRDLIQVPGIFHPGYQNGQIPFFQKINIEGWKMLMVHDLGDVKEVFSNENIILHGHTHHHEIRKFEKTWILNPGHLKQEYHRGRDASYMILEVEAKQIRVLIKALDGKIISETIIKR